MITFDRTDMFGSQVTAVSGTNGAYVVSTAKEGIFSGLSTMIFESEAPPVGGRKLLAKLIYNKSLDKTNRKKLHKELVEMLNAAIDSQEMHESLAKNYKEFYSEILKSMEADIGKNLILLKIDQWLVNLSMNKLLDNYEKCFE